MADFEWLWFILSIPLVLFLGAGSIIIVLVFIIGIAGIAMGFIMLSEGIVRLVLHIFYKIGTLVIRGDVQIPNPDPASVISLYGPGAYWAWVLAMLSAVISIALGSENPLEKPMLISVDFVVPMVYTMASSIYFYYRAYVLSLGRHLVMQDAGCQAAIHVYYTSIPFIVVAQVMSAKRSRPLWLATYFITGAWLIPVLVGDTDHNAWDTASEFFFQSIFTILTLLAWYYESRVELDSPRKKTLIILAFLVPHFILLEIGKRRPPSFAPPWFTPRSEMKIWDWDQAVAVITAAILLAYSWKAWGLPPYLIKLYRHGLQGLPVEPDSVDMELGPMDWLSRLRLHLTSYRYTLVNPLY